MPNWCYNQVTYTAADKKQLCSLRRLCHKGKTFTFSKAAPIPKGSKLDLTLASNPFILSKESMIWGTKWDVEKAEYTDPDMDSSLTGTISFHTAWGPPTGWMGIVCSVLPDLKLSMAYEEPGNCVYGISINKGGKLEDFCSNNHIKGECDFNEEDEDRFLAQCVEKIEAFVGMHPRWASYKVKFDEVEHAQIKEQIQHIQAPNPDMAVRFAFYQHGMELPELWDRCPKAVFVTDERKIYVLQKATKTKLKATQSALGFASALTEYQTYRKLTASH